MAIPAPSQADPGLILPPEEKFRNSETHLINSRAIWPSSTELCKSRIHLGVKRGKYPALLRRMLEAEMIEFCPPGPEVLEKPPVWCLEDLKYQSACDMGRKPFQSTLNESASFVELPSPEIISTLSLPQGEQIFVSGCEFSQFYNRLLAPSFLVPLIRLPRVRTVEVACDLPVPFVIPCLRVIPMGATFSVALAQAVSLAVLRRANICPQNTANEIANAVISHSRPLHIPYIDDINTVTSNPKFSNDATVRTARIAASVGLPVAEGKRSLLESLNFRKP